MIENDDLGTDQDEPVSPDEPVFAEELAEQDEPADPVESADQEQPPAPQPGWLLVGVALILPVLAGVAQCFITSLSLAYGLGFAMVLTTALLIAIDASQLGDTDPKGVRRESPVLLFFGMCALWIAVYPMAYFRRQRFCGPRLGVASLLSAALFLAIPFAAVFLIRPGLPACTSPEVARLMESLIRQMPLGATMPVIDGFREVSYDPAAEIRHGECIVHGRDGDLPVKFTVTWQDRDRAMFFVAIPPPELLECTSPMTRRLLEQTIQNAPFAAATRSTAGYRELRFDPVAQVRHGECTAHTDAGDVPVKFIVEWQDRTKGTVLVRLETPNLPACTSPMTKGLLESVIRNAPFSAVTQSTDGYREVRFDTVAQVRHGECIAHTDSGDVPVKFLIQWLDHDKGMILVRMETPNLPACTSPDVLRVLGEVLSRSGMTMVDGHREVSFDAEAIVRQGACTAHTDMGDVQIQYFVEWQDREKAQFRVRVAVKPKGPVNA